MSENDLAAMKMNPNYRVFKRIDEVDIEVEVEKGMTKARYSWMNENNGNNNSGTYAGTHTNNDAVDRNDDFKVLDIENKVADYANIRATDLPTVQRLFPPKPSTMRREIVMQNMKDKILNKVKEYKENNCNDKGFIKNKNIDKVVEDGLKEVTEKVKQHEMVVFSTDKTGKFSVDTVENHQDALMEHVANDTKINRKKVRILEKKCNSHLKQFNRMFGVGSAWGHQNRVAGASTATNVSAPALDGLRKDHKTVLPGQEQSGPSVRPVCKANQAPNNRLGYFLSKVINDYSDCAENKTECRSSEEMRAAFENFNSVDRDLRLKCKIISMDVKALYPSMSWSEIVKAIKEMIIESEMKTENVDWLEVGKYLSVMMTPEEIQEEGLINVIPKRRGVRLRRITINYLQQKKNSDKWLPARRPGVRQKRRMLALAVSYGVYTAMSSHTYTVGDEIFLQSSGGPIGLGLTGAVARPFMLRWDRLYLKLVKKSGMEMLMYDRYIDDSNQAAVVPPPGAQYDRENEKVVIDANFVMQGEMENERLARVLKDIANSVMPGIIMEDDFPSKNSDNKMPILDMKVWAEDKDGFIMFQHYQKPMSCKKIMHAKSALSASCKKSVHTQEIIRRLLNSSLRLDWNREVAPVVSTYMARMMQADYPEKYRKDTLCRSLRIYDKMVHDNNNGVRPIYRPKNWNHVQRRQDRDKKKSNWSTRGGHVAPIFVPPTPEGQLAKAIRDIVDREAEDGVRFKIVESGGASILSKVQKSNPTATAGCDSADCLPCQTGRGGGGDCRSCGVNYQIECQLCPANSKSLYIGESSRNLYSRGKEHTSSCNGRKEKSFMWRHQREEHGGVAGNFTARVTGKTRDCLTRQVREAVHIRRCSVPVMNSKTEWHQPPLFRVQNEILRG